MYLCFSIGVIWGNIDYFIFNNEKFLFSNYIIISTSLFLIIIIIIAAGVELYSTVNNYNLLNNGVASGKCGFHTLRAFSPLIPMVCRLFTNYSYTLSIIYNKLFSLTLKSPLLLYYL